MEAQIVTRRNETYTVVLFPSTSNPNVKYRVDVVNQRCSCPAWKFSRDRKPCKHLRALGFTTPVEQLSLPIDNRFAEAL
jgi:hypothetical protein